MSALDVATATLAGEYDVFDHCAGLIDHVADLLGAAELPCTMQTSPDRLAEGLFTSGDDQDNGGIWLYDPAQEMQAQLDRARELLDQARQLVVQVHESIP